MLNNWTGAGRLTKNVELRQTQSGKSVANFSIAIDRDFKTQEGERETDFVDVIAWGATGEFVSKYFSRGSMILVNGRLQVRTWKDDDGNSRRVYEIVANNVYFGGDGKKDDSAPSAGGTRASKPNSDPKPTYAAAEEDSEDEDSLPF